MYFLVRVEIYCFLFRSYSIAHYTLLRKGALSEGKDCRRIDGRCTHRKVKNSTPQPLDPEGLPRRLAGSHVWNVRTATRGSWGIQRVNSLCSLRYARSATIDPHQVILH